MEQLRRFVKRLGGVAGLAVLLIWGLSGTLTRTTQAATSIYVRPGGNDTACNGVMDADYSASVAPLCAVATISRALQLVATGGVVNVAAGQYLLGTVDITRAVTLNGPNAFISPNFGARTPEAVLTGVGAQLRLTGRSVANVTIQGFTFQTISGTLSSSGVIEVSSTSGMVSNLTFARNRFIDIRNRHAIWASLSPLMPGQNWVVTDNRVDTVSACSAGQTCNAFSLGNVNALTVTNNVIRNVTAGAGILLLNNQEVLIAGNILTGTRDGLQLSGTARNVTIVDNSVTQVSRDGLFLQGSAFTGTVSVLRNTFTEAGRAINISGAINHNFLQLRYNIFTASLTNTLYLPGTLAGVVDATCNWYGHLSGPAFRGNPGGLGQSVVVTTTSTGELRFRPWLIYDTDGQVAQPGWQPPASFTVTALNSGFSAADNNYRRLANAFGCVTSGQTLNLSGAFDWTEANAQVAYAAGPDGNPATTGDNLRLNVPGGVSGVTVSGPASINGGARSGRFLLLFGDNDRWRFSGLSFSNFATGLELSARAVLTGTTFLNTGSFTGSGVGLVLRSGAAVTVTNGSFNQLGLGLDVSGGEALVAHTVFAGNGTSVRVQGAGLADLGNTDPDDPAKLTALGASAGCNNFIGNALPVLNLTATEIEAEGNWWGLPLGPGALPGVDFMPFRSRPCFTYGVYLPLVQR